MAVTMKNAVFWDKKTSSYFTWDTLHLRYRAQPVNAMYVWGFHSGAYEGFRLVGYRNPVHTSQETLYISATNSNLFMLSKIWGFHGGDYEECRHLGYKIQVSILT
jgi:hypothetical protein